MKIIRKFRKKTIDLLSSERWFSTSLTNKSRVENLIKSLSPIETSKPLIRLGPNGDGGYLIPDDLVGIDACFSPGVSFVSGFESDCAARGMKVYMADKSVDQPAESHENFNFIKNFLGCTNAGDFITIDNWVIDSNVSESSDLILQIDIEGYEYEVFLSCSDELMKRFRIIVAEFHFLEQLWNEPFFNIASRVFDKINETHMCVHIHPNNYSGIYKKSGLSIPSLAEFTFLRKDRISSCKPAKKFPHPLDFDNTANKTIILPDCFINKLQG